MSYINSTPRSNNVNNTSNELLKIKPAKRASKFISTYLNAKGEGKEHEFISQQATVLSSQAEYLQKYAKDVQSLEEKNKDLKLQLANVKVQKVNPRVDDGLEELAQKYAAMEAGDEEPCIFDLDIDSAKRLRQRLSQMGMNANIVVSD